MDQAASNAPTFIGGNLIVSEIEVQVARDPELNLGNHRVQHVIIIVLDLYTYCIIVQ